MKKIILTLLSILLLVIQADARDYSVKLFSLDKNIQNAVVEFDKQAYLYSYNNRVLFKFKPYKEYDIKLYENLFRINAEAYRGKSFIKADCITKFKVNNNTRQIFCKKIYFKKGSVVVTTDIESLTSAVTLSEAHTFSLAEYIKAQAVAARSYIAASTGKHISQGYDFCDSTCCQVIKNIPFRKDMEYIIKSTEGEYLCCKDKILPAFYHSTCGGKTALPGDVFKNNIPGFNSIYDISSRDKAALCSESPHYNWGFIVNKEDLKNILNKDKEYYIGNYISDIKISGINNNRVKNIELIGQNSKKISGYDFYLLMGNSLGWGKLKSTRFTVKKSGGDFIFTGYGLGHGIGLCQYGAAKMAELGYDYREILKHYYPYVEIVRR
ncbi:MAG: SpoIID/LytB domain-containing protein [Armatimonadota bacterium]